MGRKTHWLLSNGTSLESSSVFLLESDSMEFGKENDCFQGIYEAMSMTDAPLSPDDFSTFPSESLSASSWSENSVWFPHRLPRTTSGIVGKCVSGMRRVSESCSELAVDRRGLDLHLDLYLTSSRRPNQRDATANTAWPQRSLAKARKGSKFHYKQIIKSFDCTLYLKVFNF